jgi:hypothetical protein
MAHYLFQFAFADNRRLRLHLSDLRPLVLGAGRLHATMGSEGNFLSGLGMNFHDFAGSTVVHSIGGWVAIAGAIMLGPRLGRKFKRDGGGPMPPHDLTIAVIGGLILWFGACTAASPPSS